MPENAHSKPFRAVIYARYSSDKQKDASIEDQVELCRRYIERQNWTLLTVYEDRAMSGASDHRPGYRQMVADAETHQFDVIVCEALDRLGRRLADISSLYDRLEFAGVKMHAANIGQLTPMHIGMLGTMAQLYLSDLKEKTRRGQMGLVRAGKVPGGKAYGYDLVEGKPGERQVNKSQAAVIRRIFKEYASGKSPRVIAKGLNAEGISGPTGGAWQDTTIRGQPKRGAGILNNASYIGRQEWDHCSYVKNPSTGKKLARPNPEHLWEIGEVPHQRIVDDDLWAAVKKRQQEMSFEIGRDDNGNALNICRHWQAIKR